MHQSLSPNAVREYHEVLVGDDLKYFKGPMFVADKGLS